MPFDSRPIILRGGRFTMATRVLPTRSSGLYHLCMPERIWRSTPVPSSRVNLRSLSDFLTASQLLTLTTRKSDLQKVSKSTFSVSWGSSSMGGRAALRASSSSFSSSASSFVMSMRGKSVSPFVTLTFSGRLPQWAALSQQRTDSSAPIWAKARSQLSGMKGVSRQVQMRRVSSRLYMTEASLARFDSSLARTQGAFSSIYLLAREMTLNISSSAAWVWKVSMSFSYLPRSSEAMPTSSASASAGSRSAGRVPSKYLRTIATVRERRLP